MVTPGDTAAERRGALLLDLLEAADRILRESLRRRYPEASREEIERRVRDWYMSRDEADETFAPPLRVVPNSPR